MRWTGRLLLPLLLCLVVAPSAARAACPNGMPIDQTLGGGNIFTEPSRSYGGWFWLLGSGNNLLNGDSEPEYGRDSGSRGAVPIDPTPNTTEFLQDLLGDGSTRTITGDWGNPGTDGCGDLNRNGRADPDEVAAVLVVDAVGEQFAMLSVGGGPRTFWQFGRVNNGETSAHGSPGNGVPMTPVPKPRFGRVSSAAGGRVSVEVIPPTTVPTFDEVGGGRDVVQGFHILQDELLLAEIGKPGGSVTVKAEPGRMLVLRTIFGYPGDAGFYVDAEVPVPRAGEPGDQAPRTRGGEPSTPGADTVQPTGEGPADPGAPSYISLGAVPAEEDEEATGSADGDEDEILDDEDNCPGVANPEQEDGDADGIGDYCDSCPFDSNPEQEDGDDDGLGDPCDPCPTDADNLDGDGDGACDVDDNCVDVWNDDQSDEDGDGSGDACDDSFDPFVVLLKAPKESASPGEELALKLVVVNRAPSRRTATLVMVWLDASEVETTVKTDPDCLPEMTAELELDPGETAEDECAWSVPEGTATGKGTLRIDVVDVETEVRARGEVELQIR